MRSQRVQKRPDRTLVSAPRALAAAPRGALHARLWERAPLIATVLLLTALAAWASFALEREIVRSIRQELRVVLQAQTEVVKALLGAEVTSRGQPASPELFTGALQRVSQTARVGATGETYAFDGKGLLLTHSRFAEELRHAGWLHEVAGRPHIELRDPGGPLREGYQPELPLERLPLTRMAKAALRHEPGLDVDGYRDYRGVEVVGAWTWLPEYDVGLAFEIDRSEAFALHDGLRMVLLGIYLTVVFAILAVGGSSSIAARARSELAHAQQLGQYTLGRELGRGGMGTVYEARHAHLRRATAVKLMSAPSGDAVVEAEALLRFEREVQLTSQLSHPNTIVIYDYGRTDEGIFYYAMEYIDGVDLEKLIRIDGPIAPGRLIHFALQVAGSLSEAHEKSLIHRDIKPANLIVCERGGIPDTIKVLDFGLVKSLLGPQVSAAHVIVGTPHFMAPEVMRDPLRADVQSDIYSLGAVMYWLATGHTPRDEPPGKARFEPHAPVKPPSQHRADVPVDLERVILRCLSREPFARPLSMAELAIELRSCRSHGTWSAHDARRYWRERGNRFAPGKVAPNDIPTLAAT